MFLLNMELDFLFGGGKFAAWVCNDLVIYVAAEVPLTTVIAHAFLNSLVHFNEQFFRDVFFVKPCEGVCLAIISVDSPNKHLNLL